MLTRSRYLPNFIRTAQVSIPKRHTTVSDFRSLASLRVAINTAHRMISLNTYLLDRDRDLDLLERERDLRDECFVRDLERDRLSLELQKKYYSRKLINTTNISTCRAHLPNGHLFPHPR